MLGAHAITKTKAWQYARNIVDGKTVLDPNSFHYIESKPASFFDIFRAVPYGLTL